MKVLKAGLLTYWHLLPLIVMIEVLFLGANYLLNFNLRNVGGQLVVQALIVFWAHAVLLEGHGVPWKGDAIFPTPKFGALLVIGAIFAVPLLLAAGLTLWMPAHVQVQGGNTSVLSLVIGSLVMWLALSIFGTAIPRQILCDIGQPIALRLAMRPTELIYVASMMAASGLLLYSGIFGLGHVLADAPLGNALLSMLAILPTCVIASILSHALFRANGLPQRGYTQGH